MEVRVETAAPLRVAFIRHVGPFQGLGETWGRLMAWAGPRGLLGPRTRFLGLYHDAPEVSAPEQLRGDACMTVDEGFTGEGEMGVQEIAGGEYAVATHRGPYDRLSDTYALLCGQWVPAHGRELRAAPSYEI